MLQKEGNWNDLSPALVKELEDKILGFGKSVRYKFDISHEDPNPENKGKQIWPFQYTLKPVTFNIEDKQETRAGVQKYKKIGIVEETEEKGGHMVPKKFKRVKIHSKDNGIKKYDLSKSSDIEEVWYLELHGKLSNGKFSDKDQKQVVTRIDEMAAATTARAERTARKKAMDVAEAMDDKAIVEFAEAMLWDSTQDPALLKNDVEALAETNPVFFNDLVKDKTVEYRALVKKAMDKGVIAFDPGEYKFVYKDNQQVITMLSPVGDKSEVYKFAEFLMVGGAKADEVYKKIKALVKENN